MRSRAKQLRIAISIYSPARGSRPIYHAKEDSRSRISVWGAVTEYLKGALFHHFGLAMFGNLEVFFVSLSLLSHCFVIVIKYSRAQKGTQAITPPLSSLSIALELNGYFE